MRKIKPEDDMRTKTNRKKETLQLSADQIMTNYNERGRLLKSEVEQLVKLASKPSPLDEFKHPENEVYEGLDNEQIITLGVGIGTWMLMLLERSLPEHTLLKRKDRIENVEKALLELAHGLGKPVSSEMLDYWSAVWNLTWNESMNKIKRDFNLKD